MDTATSAADELRQLRSELRNAAERTSLRAVATGVGMSPTGLQNVIEGRSTPHPSTRHKIRQWLVLGGCDRVTGSDARQMLERLLSGFEDADAAITAVVQMIERLHRSEGFAAPLWIRQIRQDLGRDGAS